MDAQRNTFHFVSSSQIPQEVLEPRFISRQLELRQLDAAFESLRHGNGYLVQIESESGGGKTRLLDEIMRRCQRQSLRVIRGGAIGRTGQRPFRLLDAVTRELIRLHTEDKTRWEDFKAKFDSDAETLCSALPALKRLWQSEKPQRIGPEEFLENRTLSGLVRVIQYLGTAEAPLVFLFDDCQWADESTIKVLRDWQEASLKNPTKTYVACIATFSTEEVPANHLLRQLRPSLHLVLKPFSETENQLLFQSMLGHSSTKASKMVHSIAKGNAFMICSTVRGLAEQGIIKRLAHGWDIDEAALRNAQSSIHDVPILLQRLQLLPSDCVRLLEASAVIGKRFRFDMALSLSSLDLSHGLGAANTLSRRHIIWEVALGTFAFSHDKIRETVLDSMSKEHQLELHLKAAEYLRGSDTKAVFEIAYHLSEGGACLEALPFALDAARQARKQANFQIAEKFYWVAERGCACANTDTRFEICEGLGDMLMHRGSSALAEEKFRQALLLANSDYDRAKIYGRLGELFAKSGETQKAKAAIQRGLKNLNRRIPKFEFVFFFAALKQLSIQVLHSVFPKIFLARKHGLPSESTRLALYLYSRYAYVAWFEGVLATVWSHLRGMNEAEGYPPTAELAQSYSEHAVACTMIPMFERGLKYGEESRRLRESFGDLWGQSQSIHYKGILLTYCGRWGESTQQLSQALEYMERVGDRWESDIAQVHLAYSLSFLGRSAEAVEILNRAYDRAKECDDRGAIALCLFAWSRADISRMPTEFLFLELDYYKDALSQVCILQAQARFHLAHANTARALEALNEAHRIIRKGKLRQEFSIATYPLVCTAVRKHIEKEGKSRRLMRRYRWALRRAKAFSACFTNHADCVQTELEHYRQMANA